MLVQNKNKKCIDVRGTAAHEYTMKLQALSLNVSDDFIKFDLQFDENVDSMKCKYFAKTLAELNINNPNFYLT
jgi:hypothetical protein